jgi:hypothetical protein
MGKSSYFTEYTSLKLEWNISRTNISFLVSKNIKNTKFTQGRENFTGKTIPSIQVS